MAATAGFLQALFRLAPRLPDRDRDLLRRFAETRDGPAFTELLRRHGGLVWSVCRRHSRDRADAEDAFQATFLVLAARPRAVRRGDSLGSWLHGTARRTATRLRTQRVRAAAVVEVAATPEDSDRWDALAALDEELLRLPAKYRDPLTAYYLLARTHAEVADELGQSVSTVRRCLDTGRELLRERLSRRGVELSAVVAACAVQTANAPANLSQATLTAATLGAATVPPLVQGVLTMMWYAKVKAWAVGVVVAAVTVGGVGTLATCGPSQGPPAAGATKPETPAEQAKPPRAEVAGLPDGNYLLSLSGGFNQQHRLAILKIETKAGRPGVSVLDAGPPSVNNTPPGLVLLDAKRPSAKVSASDLKIDGESLGMTLDLGGNFVTFEGSLDLKTGGSTSTFSQVSACKFEGVLNPKSPRTVRGYLAAGERVSSAFLEATDKVKLETSDLHFQVEEPAELAEARKRAMTQYQAKAKGAEAKDPREKARYERESETARLATEAEMPGVFRKMLADHPGTPVALNAAEALIAGAVKSKASIDDVGRWAAVVEANAARHGPRYVEATVNRLAESLDGVDNYVPLALKYCERAAAQKGLSPRARVAALSRLARVQKAAVVVTERELARYDAELDAAAFKAVPPFKPAPFPGRKDKAANRVAVVELFTGAHCGPCVAADVAFDAAVQAYPARDVVLLQYHLNIPAPDPLAHADSAARFGYYSKRNDGEFYGTPSLALNGKLADAGGGGMADAEANFAGYQKLLDEALTQSTPVTLTGTATTTGDTLAVAVTVAGLDAPKDSVKLRLVLVEETVKYAGNNGLRFHHNVVRGMLGTSEGVPVSGLEGGQYAVTVSVKELRDKLEAELANADKPLADADRPLELKSLKVMALVQDDTTGAILQAATLEAAGK